MHTIPSQAFKFSLCAVALAALAACGGGGDDGPVESGPVDSGPGRGALLEAPKTLTTLTVAQIDATTAASGLQAVSGKALCDVKVVALNYATAGANGERSNATGPIDASGVMLVPTGAGACSTAAALVAYARGTNIQKPRTLANPSDSETFVLAAMFAAQGYAVVATDYLGYAKSNYAYHPYLHAESEASAVIDSIRAARNASAQVGASLSGKVMINGFSQGGHSSMAAHRAAERDNAAEINVVGSANLAGPYNLSGYLKAANAGSGYQVVVPYMLTGYQKAYGNVYGDVNTVFKAPYASTIENLMPSMTLTLGTVITTGALPGGNGESPNQARDLLFQPAFITDLQTNANNGSYLAARKNDLLGWNPKSRVLLCGGSGDPVVSPAIHQNVMKADFDSRGLVNVTSVDVDPTIQLLFGPGGVAPTDPALPAFATYYGNYHAAYQAPLCQAQAKAFFDTLK